MDILGQIFSLCVVGALFFFGPALSAIAIRRSLAIRWQWVLVSICLFYGIFPLLVALGGLGLAEGFRCKAEIIIYKCPGSPWLGELITGMVFAHWGAIITIPSGILGLIGLSISLALKAKTLRTDVHTAGRPASTFYRSRRHKVLGGICAAVAQQWRLPLLGVRIATVVLVIITGMAIPLYLWLWLAFPLEPGF